MPGKSPGFSRQSRKSGNVAVLRERDMKKAFTVIYYLMSRIGNVTRLIHNLAVCVTIHSFSFLFFFFHLTYSRWTSSLPSCLWSQRIFPSLPGSRLTIFLSRCNVSTLTTRQPMVEFYLLTFPRFPLRKKEHKSYFGKNRTHDFRTSRCAAYLLDHSGDDTIYIQSINKHFSRIGQSSSPLSPVSSTFLFSTLLRLWAEMRHESRLLLRRVRLIQ